MFSINARLINPESLDPDDLLVRCGFQKGGPVQCLIDERVLEYSWPYVPAGPRRILEDSAGPTTEIGSGRVIWNTPYARYQYYGVVVTDEQGRTFVGPGEKKPVVTNRPLKHDTAQNRLAGPFWVERMKADHMGDILDEARKRAQEELRKHG